METHQSHASHGHCCTSYWILCAFHPPAYPSLPLREQCPSATFGTMSSFALSQYAPMLEQRCGLRTLVLLLEKGEVALKGWRHKNHSTLSPADRQASRGRTVSPPECCMLYVTDFDRPCTHWVFKPEAPSQPDRVWPNGANNHSSMGRE